MEWRVTYYNLVIAQYDEDSGELSILNTIHKVKPEQILQVLKDDYEDTYSNSGIEQEEDNVNGSTINTTLEDLINLPVDNDIEEYFTFNGITISWKIFKRQMTIDNDVNFFGPGQND